MSEWSVVDGDYPSCSYEAYLYPFYTDMSIQPVPAQCQPPTQAQLTPLTELPLTVLLTPPQPAQPVSRGGNPRELRNKAEKQRRDRMNQSISELASIVPPVTTAGRKVDKTSVLRLTAHYLRSHRHVFGMSMNRGPNFSSNFIGTVLKTMKGFLITTTYKGIVVVVSPNIQEYLGYTELELLGQNLYKIVHPEDHHILREQLFPRYCQLTSNGELLLPTEPDAAKNVAESLKKEKRNFIIRIKKFSHLRTEPVQYVTCHVEGAFRKSDRAGVHDDVIQRVRRVRSRKNNPYSSGNDIVFVGMVRPATETFINDYRLESFKMEYRTRHSIDGGIIQCEQKISLITGYMIHEVNGVNAMNFMHRDDVRWVVIALREMYDQRRLMGESCYRLMTKNGRFIYMRTTGRLDVDPTSKEATSFVCTNTMVAEHEGIQLIKLMKKKFALMVNNEEPKEEDITVNPEINEKESLPVEDPRQLAKVIFHLVTDLPSPHPNYQTNIPDKQDNSTLGLAIIPPEREQIEKAIEKSYSVIKTLRKSELTSQKKNMDDNTQSSSTPPATAPQENSQSELNTTSLSIDEQKMPTEESCSNTATTSSSNFSETNNAVLLDEPLIDLNNIDEYENISHIINYLKTHGLINNFETTTSHDNPQFFDFDTTSSSYFQSDVAHQSSHNFKIPPEPNAENLELNAAGPLLEEEASITFSHPHHLELLRQYELNENNSVLQDDNNLNTFNDPPDDIDIHFPSSYGSDVQESEVPINDGSTISSPQTTGNMSTLKRRVKPKKAISETRKRKM